MENRQEMASAGKKLAAMNTQITLLNQRLDALALKAGPAPTASAVLGDVVTAARNRVRGVAGA